MVATLENGKGAKPFNSKSLDPTILVVPTFPCGMKKATALCRALG